MRFGRHLAMLFSGVCACLAGTALAAAPPVLAIAKTHSGTFTQGSTGHWNLVVSNTASAADVTDGTTVTVRDTLPAGYTLQQVASGNEWNCTGSTAAVALCTTTSVLAGGGATYSTISLTVSIPANSPTSVTNTGGVFGGGDTVHTSAGSAATSSDTVTVVQVPATVTVTAGNNQSAQVNTAFATPLTATVTDAGSVAIPSFTVTFTAPGSGASALFSNSTATISILTNASGVASAPVTANGTAGGPYSVTAAAGAVTGTFSLTNTGVGPVVTANPTDQSVNSGQTATFMAAASGSPTPTVQWQLSSDGGATFGNIGGATSTTLSFSSDSTLNGNKYRAVFTNPSGSATTTAATLTVNFAPSVTTNPTSQSVSAGSNVTFTVAATGNPTPTVQWQQSTDGGATFQNIAGATTTTLSFTALASQNGNEYRAVFTNSVGSATTTAATLTVTQGPQVTANPTDQSVNSGQTATFSATAAGTPTPTVQWQLSTDGGATFGNIGGATSTTLSFPTDNTMNGNKYRAVFTNPSGSATTTAATLTVITQGPVITNNPTNQTVSNGQTATFTASATGAPTPTVQWQVSTDGGASFNNVAGATSTTLSFTATTAANGNKYRAVFTNPSGSATTTAATLAVTIVQANSTVSLSISPNPVEVGAPVTLTATVDATPPAAFGPLPGMTASATAATGTVTFADAGVTIATITLGGSTAIDATQFSVAGSHTITASYSGDANTLPSTASAILVVAAAPVAVPAPTLSWPMLALLTALLVLLSSRAIAARATRRSRRE